MLRTTALSVLQSGLWIFLTGLALFLTTRITYADHGPKPSQTFQFVYQTAQPIPIWDGQLLDCGDPACTTSTPVDKRVVAYFRCSTDSCNATSPTGYAQYQKLVIRFADKSRESGPFTHRDNGDFHNEFTVTVRENDLRVAENPSVYAFINPYQVVLFFPALIFTLTVELIIATIYLKVTKLFKARILLWIVLVNILSVPVVWFVLPQLYRGWHWDATAVIALAEVFALVFEAAFLYLTNRGILTLPRAGLLSLLMNAGSFLIGLCSLNFS